METALALVSFGVWLAGFAQEPQTPAPTPSTQAPRAPQQIVPPAPDTDLDRRIDAAIRALRRDVADPPSPDELVTAGSAGREEPPSFEELRALVRQATAPSPNAVMPADPARRDMSRLERAVDALERRAREGPLSVAHVDMLHERLIDQRIDALLDEVGRQLSAGASVDPATLSAVRDRIERRVAVATSFDPKASELLDTVRSPLAMLRDRAAVGLLTRDDLRGFRRILSDARIEHAISTIEARSRARDLGVAEIQRLRDLVDEYVERAPDPEAARREYAGLTGAIDALDEGVRDGTLERNEAYALRRELERTAREASYEKPREVKQRD